MKKLILVISFAALSIIGFSQSSAFKKGDNLGNLGVGLSNGIIPITGTFEKGITDNISIGPSFNYWSKSYDYGKTSAISFAARGSYHFNISNDKFDLYGIFSLGYIKVSDTYNIGYLSGSTSASGIYWGIGAGGKYYFSDNLGAFAELGVGGSNFSNLNIGVAFKF